MPEPFRILGETVREIDARSALDIVLLALIVYLLLQLLRGTTAMSLLRGGAIIFAAAAALAYTLNLTVLQWLLERGLAGLAVAVPIIFQPEIRRTLERAGRTRVPALRTRPAVEALVMAIAVACRELSARRHGALMVIERETGLEDYIATGQRVDAVPSGDLIGNIFYRNSPLHDGAMIFRGDRIVAAGCTLPLTDAAMDGHVGTRHRAGIGITERTDAISVIVSEETGDISIAANGRLITKLDDEGLRAMLLSLLGGDGRGSKGRQGAPARGRGLWRRTEREVLP